jgi:hypothetical protein
MTTHYDPRDGTVLSPLVRRRETRGENISPGYGQRRCMNVARLGRDAGEGTAEPMVRQGERQRGPRKHGGALPAGTGAQTQK